jgi:Cu(I)/Ag(I) efflux system membrane fusion protein
MKRAQALLALAAAIGLAAGGYGLYKLGMHHGSTAVGLAAPAANTPTGRTVLYWHDPMVPGQRFDKPGKSPFMDMPLVPVYAGGAGEEGGVSISPAVRQNLGIRTAEVTRGAMAPALSVVGNVVFNERNLVEVQARGSGYIERLYMRASFDPVRKGQPLADLYVPEWVAAQEEYFTVKRMRDAPGSEGLLDAARQRMRLAGMTEDLIRQVEAGGKTRARLTLTSPVSGVVTDLLARQGMTVAAGAPLFRINGLQSVWVEAEVPEMLGAQVRPGSTIDAQTAALPGVALAGKVSAILPRVDPATRTLKARIELHNPGGRLVPGMFVTVNIRPAVRREALLAPSEAVIRTGERNVVIVRSDDGSFVPTEVQIGFEADGRTEIRHGLEAGQKVVASGQFLIDSEASLKAAVTRLGAGASDRDAAGAAAAHGHSAEGTVESIAADEIVLSHGPVPALQWEAMTMGFKPPAGGLPKGIAVGDKVRFRFHQAGEGVFEIVAIERSAGGQGEKR